MSTVYLNSLKFAGQHVASYGGLTVLIFGLLGGALNLLIFLTLRTFRQSSSAFYLIIMTIFNIGQLLVGLLTRTLTFINPNNSYDNSIFYCKLRLYSSHVCVMTSLTCFCLATIDQYCGTSSYQKLRRMCRIKTAAMLVSLGCIFWILHGIPYIIFSQPNQSSNSSAVQCIIINNIYSQYRSYVYLLVLSGFLPLSIIIVFGLMALRNIKNMLHYTVPLIRQELDKQITRMILTQVIACILSLLPYAIASILSKIVQSSNSSALVQAQADLNLQVTLIIYYLYFAVSSFTMILQI